MSSRKINGIATHYATFEEAFAKIKTDVSVNSIYQNPLSYGILKSQNGYFVWFAEREGYPKEKVDRLIANPGGVDLTEDFYGGWPKAPIKELWVYKQDGMERKVPLHVDVNGHQIIQRPKAEKKKEADSIEDAIGDWFRKRRKA